MTVAPLTDISLYHGAEKQYQAGNYSAALASLEDFLAGSVRPPAEALGLAGACAQHLGYRSMAGAYLTRAIALQPNGFDVHIHHGNWLFDESRFVEAECAYRRALSIDSRRVESHFQLGTFYYRLGRITDAEFAYRQAVRVSSADGDSHYNLGLVLAAVRRWSEAVDSNKRALTIRPDYADAYTNLANALAICKRKGAAAVAYGRALNIAPNNPDMHYNLGTVLESLKMFDAARVAYQFALKLKRDHCAARWKLSHVRSYLCDWRTAEDEVPPSSLISAIPEQGGVSPFVMLAKPGLSPLDQLEVAREISTKRGYDSLAATKIEAAPNQDPTRLCIGYLSADFHDHATTRLLAGVLEHHNRSQFAVHLYSYGPDVSDAARERLIAASECFRELSKLSDHESAQQIAADEVDILVDLKGYTANSRLGITARRPARITASWLGYPGSLGCPQLADYLIGDTIVSPLKHAAHFSETLALLPHCYQPNDRSRNVGTPPSRSEAGLPEASFVFCNFNQTYKLNPETFDVWCSLLHAIPDSVLWLLDSSAVATENLRCEAVARGIAPTRLVFAHHTDPSTHLQRLQCADLALDTFPYGSHTTGSDALWSGVPLVTRLGETFASRVASSLLQAVGLPELITETWDEYLELATSLASDGARLASLRARLARQRLSAPLFDTVRFAHDLERLYQCIWRDYCEGVRKPIVLAKESILEYKSQ